MEATDTFVCHWLVKWLSPHITSSINGHLLYGEQYEVHSFLNHSVGCGYVVGFSRFLLRQSGLVHISNHWMQPLAYDIEETLCVQKALFPGLLRRIL